MNVLLVSSGHQHSTFDIGAYYHKAFKELNIQTREFRLDLEFQIAMGVIGYIKIATVDKEELYNKVHSYYGDGLYLAAKSLIAEITMHEPDYVIFITGVNIFHKFWDWYGSLCNRLRRPPKSATILTESPYKQEDELEIAWRTDCVFTNERTFLDLLKRVQPLSFYLRHAYYSGVHYHENRQQENEVYFCGSGHIQRLREISLIEWGNIDFKLRGMFPMLYELAPHLGIYYEEGATPNRDVAEEYRKSKICLNIHRTNGERTILKVKRDDYYSFRHMQTLVNNCYSVNNRTIEIAACGAFQLCDNTRPELTEIFGNSVATYSDADELRDKVEFYLEHDDIRNEMARKSLAAVQGNTYQNNAKKIMQTLEKL